MIGASPPIQSKAKPDPKSCVIVPDPTALPSSLSLGFTACIALAQKRSRRDVDIMMRRRKLDLTIRYYVLCLVLLVELTSSILAQLYAQA